MSLVLAKNIKKLTSLMLAREDHKLLVGVYVIGIGFMANIVDGFMFLVCFRFFMLFIMHMPHPLLVSRPHLISFVFPLFLDVNSHDLISFMVIINVVA